MNVVVDRHGRKDQAAKLALAAICLVLGIAPAAHAGTGGAAVVAADGTAPAGQSLVFSPMRAAGATWYGPGLYGNQTACGQTLMPVTVGVAHRTLPCGTTVKFAYRGRYLVTQVIDRGPFTVGNAFDLTNGARLALDFDGAGRVRYAVALQYARPR
jgi:rare lipoprotein A